MKQILRAVEEKLSHLFWALITTAGLLVILAVLVAWSAFLTQILIALVILLIAYTFFFAAAKLHGIKKLFK